MPKVVLLGAVVQDQRLTEQLGAAWQVAAVSEDAKPSALADAFSDADAVIAFEVRQDLPPAPRLRLLQVPGAGYDQICIGALPSGCTMCNVYEHETGIAEYVLLGMLELTVGMRQLDQRLRESDWSDYGTAAGPKFFRGELAGKTLGIIGFGHIGREVARRARAFDMRIGAITRTPILVDPLAWAVPVADLDVRLPECDFLLVACPLDATTHGLINRNRLALMKRSSVLINVARGGIIDEDALYDALRDRTIASAVIDVWYIYPSANERNPHPAHRPFHELPNVIMTPHASGWTDKLLERRWQVIAENLQRLVEGKELLNVVRRL
jgi:phosphoglycerate dehydrogenase-like enzyme